MEKEGKLIILFSFILLAFLILFGFTQFFEGHPIRQFCVVITTDSLGTKSSLYTWHRFNKTRDNMPIEIYEVLDLEQNDSGYDVLLTASKDQLDSYFNSILKSASSEIQKGIKSFTPIYFNLLLENGENKETFSELTQKINTKLQNSGFFFDNTHINFIDEKQKASYLWLITNYLLRFYSIEFYSLSNTVAVHHISNDSVTIAYATNDTRNKNNLVETEIFGQNYTLYAESFDKLGFVTSFDNMLNNISTQNKYTGCLPLNYKVETPQYTIFGMSDFPSCQTAVRKLLNMSDACYNSNNCTINGKFIPLPVSPLFYASNVHLIDFLGLNNNVQTHTSAPITNYTTLLSNVTKMCDLSLDQYKSIYNADPLNYCFDGTLMLSLYNYAFRLSDKTNIMWSKEIGELQITWEGGFFLEVGSEYYPWGNFVLVNMGDNFRISFLVISLVISVFSAGFLIFLVIRLVKKKKMYNNYENITVL